MSNDEKMDLILESIQLIAMDRLWETDNFRDRAIAIDKRITDILNPKVNPGVAERTHDALKGSAE